MKTVLIYGAPGVGKLTVAKELSKITGFKLLHNHLINDLIAVAYKFGTPEFFDIVHKYRLDIMEKVLKNNNEGLILTWVYAKKEDDKILSKIIKQALKNNGKIFFVRLTCDKKELFKRIKSPSRKIFRKIKTSKKLNETMKTHDFFSNVPHEPNLVIDNTKTSPKTAAKIIKKFYQL